MGKIIVRASTVCGALPVEGAAVYINGEFRGYTGANGYSGLFEADGETCTLKIKADGYEKYLLPDERYGDNAVKKCIDFIYPYYILPESFPYQEMAFDFPEFMVRLLSWADSQYPDMGYEEKIKTIAGGEETIPAFPTV